MKSILNQELVLVLTLILYNVEEMQTRAIIADNAKFNPSSEAEDASHSVQLKDRRPNRQRILQQPSTIECGKELSHHRQSKPCQNILTHKNSKSTNTNVDNLNFKKGTNVKFSRQPLAKTATSKPLHMKPSDMNEKSTDMQNIPESETSHLIRRRSSDNVAAKHNQGKSLNDALSSSANADNDMWIYWHDKRATEEKRDSEPWSIELIKDWTDFPKDELFDVVRRKPSDVSRRQAPHVRGRIDPAMRYMGIGKRMKTD